MRPIAILLVVGVFLAHDGANWLADGTRFTPAAAFYMLHGAWEAVLSAMLLALGLWTVRASIWRDLSVAALVVSIIEALQLPACRFAIDDMKSVPRGMSLCDYATGLPVHAVLLTMEVFVVFCIIGWWVNRWRST